MLILNSKSTQLIKSFKYLDVPKRTMMNSKCIYTLQTAYNCMQTITAKNVIDNITSSDHSFLDKEIGLLTLNPLLGTSQHKKAILGHMFNYPMNAKTMYGLSKHTAKITTNEPVGPSSHVITELPVAEAFIDRYSPDIIKMHVTSDTMPLVMEGQKQTNFDYIITIVARNIDPLFGFSEKASMLTRMQDCKDGRGILRHSTRGSMGIITFNKEGRNIQTTPYVITEQHLVAHNKNRLKSLSEYLIQNKLYNHFKNSIDQCQMELNSSKSIFDINLAIENILWNNIQRDPMFPRSVSFVFLQKVEFSNSTSTFKERLMHSLNPNRNHLNPYSLDKKGDAKEFYISLLKAYQREVDPQIFNKLLHLKHSGIKFNNFFNDILNSCISNL